MLESSMNQTYVSLDLETTGLDPERDQIIEIGAVKFQGEEVLDTFHTLVDPGCPLPYRVRLITGITSEELETAPPFTAVATEFLSFVGSHPIVGQNIAFDLDFLHSQGISFASTVYDTLEIANILLPQLSDYSLPALAEQLGVSPSVYHRALADATTAKEVFIALLNKAHQLDLSVVAEINRLTMETDWSWRHLFMSIEREKMGGISLWDKEADFAPPALEMGREKSLIPKRTTKPLDLKRLTSVLGEGGLIGKAFPAFEYRPGQVTMMQVVAEAMNNSQHLIVEAGTGIGKSIAYLLPAVYFALQNSTHVIISTNTINLQEQLVNKDIPDLLKALDIAQNYNSKLNVAQLKGRNNYLCLRRWNSWRRALQLPWEEVKFLLRLLVWLSYTSTGDRAELNLTGNWAYLWNRICASEDNCVIERCPFYPDSCFLYRARQKTEGAHLIVTNHALLLSDLAKSGGVLPEYSYLVIDEAHHLEEEATEQLGYQVSEQDVYDCLDHFGDRGGFLFHLQNYLRTTSITSSSRREIGRRVEGLREQAKTARDSVSQLFKLLTNFLYLQAGGRGGYESNLRCTREVRTHSRWAEVEISWENLNLELGGIEAGLSELHTMLEDLPDRRGSELNSSLSELSSLRQRVLGLRYQINLIVASPEEQNICWISLRGQNDNLSLHAAPLRVGEALEGSLFSQKDCVVLTSATLSTEGNFGYMKESLGLGEAKELKELIVDAPFDYMVSTMIYLPEDIPEPDRADYQQKMEQALIELCRVTQGRTMVLFTSHAALRNTYNNVQSPLEEEGILVLGQGVDGSPKRVINTFKANPKSLLLGTASLWEGIDIVGEALSVLVIARLPFSVPTDPVFAARSELFDDSFNQYAIPQAALKFKQGFGRLIRSCYDRGVMIVFDRRIQTKSYGSVFLQSIPRCTVRSGRLRQMPQDVMGWLRD